MVFPKKDLTQAPYALEIEDLSLAYQDEAVLWDVDLRIPRGHCCALIGPNGAGKSTLLLAALDLLKPISGQVRWLGGRFKDMRRKIAYVPQQSQVNWDFPITVRDLVQMGRYPRLGFWQRLSAPDRQQADDALTQMGLEDLADRQILELSGGQRQRAFLARAICQQAEIYVLDEPLAGVDVASEKTIMDCLHNFKQLGKSIIVVHHDLSTIPRYFDYAVLLKRRVLAIGSPDEVLTPENLEAAYGLGGSHHV